MSGAAGIVGLDRWGFLGVFSHKYCIRSAELFCQVCSCGAQVFSVQYVPRAVVLEKHGVLYCAAVSHMSRCVTFFLFVSHSDLDVL